MMVTPGVGIQRIVAMDAGLLEMTSRLMQGQTGDHSTSSQESRSGVSVQVQTNLEMPAEVLAVSQISDIYFEGVSTIAHRSICSLITSVDGPF
jgi:hypothetical protein